MSKPKIKYKSPIVTHELLSKFGYSDNSPFKARPFIDINTPTGKIDMSNTGIPLLANNKVLPPYSGIHDMGTTKVREIPLKNTFKWSPGQKRNLGTFVHHNPRENQLIGGAGYTFPTGTQLNATGILPMNNDPIFKGIVDMGVKQSFGNTDVGLNLSSPILNDPYEYFANQNVQKQPLQFRPKISLTHRFQDGGSLPKAQDGRNDRIDYDWKNLLSYSINPFNWGNMHGGLLSTTVDVVKEGGISEWLAANVRPDAYPQIPNLLGEILGGDDYLEGLHPNIKGSKEWASQLDNEVWVDDDGDLTIDEEAWRMSLGLPGQPGNQPNKYIFKSDSVPSIGAKEGDVFYTTDLFDWDQALNKFNVLKDYYNTEDFDFSDVENFDPYDAYEESLKKYKTAKIRYERDWDENDGPMDFLSTEEGSKLFSQHKLLQDIEDYQPILDEFGVPIPNSYKYIGKGYNYIKESEKDKSNTLDPFANATFSMGEDENGRFISFYDKYDFESDITKGFIDPINFYDKRYITQDDDGQWILNPNQPKMKRGGSLPKAQNGSKKEEIVNTANQGVSFNEKWINSQMANNMLLNSTGSQEHADFITKARAYQLGNSGPIEVHDHQPAYSSTTGGNSISSTGDINIYPMGFDVLEMGSHEGSHSSDRPLSKEDAYALSSWGDVLSDAIPMGINGWSQYFTGNKDLVPSSLLSYPSEYFIKGKRLIPDSDVNMIEGFRTNDDAEESYYDSKINRQQESLNLLKQKDELTDEDKEEIESLEKNLGRDTDWVDYVTEPTELRARLMAIRNGANNQGIYDPFKDKVSPDIMEQLINTDFEPNNSGFDPLNQLRNIYSDEEIRTMLNEVASTEDGIQQGNQYEGNQYGISDEDMGNPLLSKYGRELPIAQNGFDFSNSFDYSPEAIAERQSRSWEEKKDLGMSQLGYNQGEEKDLAMDVGAMFHPGFDFAHAVTKANEGEYLDAALYATFGILPFSAKPLVHGTKKAINFFKEIDLKPVTNLVEKAKQADIIDYNLTKKTVNDARTGRKDVTFPIYGRDPNRVKGDILRKAAQNNERIISGSDYNTVFGQQYHFSGVDDLKISNLETDPIKLKTLLQDAAEKRKLKIDEYPPGIIGRNKMHKDGFGVAERNGFPYDPFFFGASGTSHRAYGDNIYSYNFKPDAKIYNSYDKSIIRITPKEYTTLKNAGFDAVTARSRGIGPDETIIINKNALKDFKGLDKSSIEYGNIRNNNRYFINNTMETIPVEKNVNHPDFKTKSWDDIVETMRKDYYSKYGTMQELPIDQYKYGGSLPIAQEGVEFESLKKGIKWAESLNGELMKNTQSSASGYYGQLFDDIDYDGTRDEFIADTNYQDELFRKRAHGELEGVPGLINNGVELYEEYKDVNHGLSELEIAALSNMLGRDGTRQYLGYVVRDGQTLAEVFPNLYGDDVNQTNKTPDEYITKFKEGVIKKKGGEFLNRVKRLNQQLQIFNSGGKISPLAEKELIDLEMIKPKMQSGGSNTAVQQKSYVTKRGDNLSRIAANNNMTLSELLQFNPRYASNPSAIGVGDVVQLSDAPVHNNATSNMIYEVESGDSLSKIASRYGVRYQDIAALNNISNPKLIKPGQQLTLPDNAVATGPNVAQQQHRATSVYIPSQSNVLVNSNTGVNEVWAKRKYDDVTGEWTTEGKSALIDEINKDTQANRIVRGMNDIAESETVDYTIQSGDMLGKIARENGVSVEKLMEDNNITDPRKIQPGLEIKINKSTGKPYIVVDEKAGRMHMYYPGQTEPTKSYPIVAGLMEGDQQTKTVIHFFKDGEKLEQEELQPLMDEHGFTEVGEITGLDGYTSETQWNLGNKSTGAGVYTIDAVNKTTNYMGNSPSFVLANQAGDRPGTVIHSTPSASMTGRTHVLENKLSGDEARALGVGTNGCINGTCSAMTELYEHPDIGEGTQIFILPETEGDNFVYENGKINYYTKQANDEAAQKYMAVGPDGKPGTADDVEMDNPQGLNETPGSEQGNYKPINITFDKTYYQNNSDRYDGLAAGEEQEFNDATKPFLNSLTDNKKDIMNKLGMDGDTYNDLAMIAFGIYGYESGMGDTNTASENFFKGLTKFAGVQDTNPDVQSKQLFQDIKNTLKGDDGQWDSTGYTQAKWHYIENDPGAKAMLARLGINKDNYTEFTMDPAKSAQFTIARLYDFHQKTQSSIHSRNAHRRNGTFVEGEDFAFDPVEKYGKEEEVYDPWTMLPNQWSPTSPGYSDMVNKYTDYITLTETDIDDVDNNLIIKGEYTDDNPESRKRIFENRREKGWKGAIDVLLNPDENIEFLRLEARDAIDDVTGGAASAIGDAYDNVTGGIGEMYDATIGDTVDAVGEWWDEVDLNPFWKLGGEFGMRNQVQFYDDYISGLYKGTRQENKAKKMYDKLNRVYYNDSKKSGKSQIDVMRSILHSNR